MREYLARMFLLKILLSG